MSDPATIQSEFDRLARERCARWTHITFAQDDANAWTPVPRSLDATVSVSTLHHLEPEVVLPRWRRTGRLLPDRQVHAAWKEHERFDRLWTIVEARRRTEACLPGARVHHHLLWRYSIHWQADRGDTSY